LKVEVKPQKLTVEHADDCGGILQNAGLRRGWGDGMKLKLVTAIVVGFALAVVTMSDASTAGALQRPGRPGAPLNVVAGNGSPTFGSIPVTWSAPASDGGSPILYYVATTRNGTRGCVAYPGDLTCVIHSVPYSGKDYTIRVKAVNARGTGPPGTAKDENFGPA
jgi:hypothetical protein